ncbi:MAG: hypothetical protein JOZ52_13580 [Acidobacteria bacterium]|nr:hypothetical protein [Acidobacteriota bacterium]
MKKTLTAILLLLLAAHPSLGGKAFGQSDEIPTVAFCELVKHPRLYFNK